MSGIVQNMGPILLKTVRVLKYEESLRNCQSRQEPEEMCRLTEHSRSGTDLGTPKKRTLGENQGNRNKVCNLFNYSVSKLAHICDKCTQLT